MNIEDIVDSINHIDKSGNHRLADSLDHHIMRISQYNQQPTDPMTLIQQLGQQVQKLRSDLYKLNMKVQQNNIKQNNPSDSGGQAPPPTPEPAIQEPANINIPEDINMDVKMV